MPKQTLERPPNPHSQRNEFAEGQPRNGLESAWSGTASIRRPPVFQSVAGLFGVAWVCTARAKNPLVRSGFAFQRLSLSCDRFGRCAPCRALSAPRTRPRCDRTLRGSPNPPAPVAHPGSPDHGGAGFVGNDVGHRVVRAAPRCADMRGTRRSEYVRLRPFSAVISEQYLGLVCALAYGGLRWAEAIGVTRHVHLLRRRIEHP